MECALVLLLSAFMVAACSSPDMQRRQKDGATAPRIQPEPTRNAGKSLPVDEPENIRNLRKAAQTGDAVAQMFLGVSYDSGQGVPQDHAEAIKWYRKAAEQGDDEAQFELGWAYTDGKSVPQDFIQAYMWFDLAAAHENDTYAEDYAGDFRDSLAEKMTPAQIAEAGRLAREWKPKGGD